MRSIEFICLHTAGAYDFKRREVVYQNAKQIGAYHVQHNGWRSIGYHWVVTEDGVGERGREDTEVGAHVGGFNQKSLGLCVAGHADFVPWNQAQVDEVIRKCAQWCGMYRIPVENVIGHREADEHGAPKVSKTCPGMLVDLDHIRALLAERLRTAG